jgi:hypothetical protein
LDTLAKLRQPREQTMRHVRVKEGGRAIVADEFHKHAGGRKMTFQQINPMHPQLTARLAKAPRCLARTRSGTECRSPTVSR